MLCGESCSIMVCQSVVRQSRTGKDRRVLLNTKQGHGRAGLDRTRYGTGQGRALISLVERYRAV